MQEATFTLPRPPSLNACYGNRAKGQKGRGRYVSPALARWRSMAAQEIRALGKYPRFASPVTIEIRASEDGVGRQDADNLEKPVCDFLVEMGIIIDDNRKIVRKVSCAWTDGRSGMISVIVREAPPPPAAKSKTEPKNGKEWVIKQLKRRFGIDVHPDRIHL